MEAINGLLQRIASLGVRRRTDERRRQFLVEKRFQKHLILFFTAMVVLLISSSGIAFYIFFSNIIEQNLYTVHPAVQTVRELITPNLILFFIEVSFLALVVIFLTVDRILNRTSKFLMQYARLAEHLANLDFRTVGAMERGAFQNIDRQYHLLIEQYCADINGLKENVSRMNQLLAEIETFDETADREKKLTAMMELIELRGVVAAKLTEFKTENPVKRV